MDIFKMNGRGWHWALGVIVAVLAVVAFLPLIAVLALSNRLGARTCPCRSCAFCSR